MELPYMETEEISIENEDLAKTHWSFFPLKLG